jgi:glycosyltransferase involved in cell wall biosynthesis
VNIAFYAPLKAPDHAVPSGDRRMAELLLAALGVAGHAVTMASRLRAFEGRGDDARQGEIRAAGEAEAGALVERFRAAPSGERPAAWFTYHLYHKAPDWLGPTVSRALAIPYVIAEASFAAKRAGGPWAEGHGAVAEAIGRAGAVLALTGDDRAGLAALVGDGERLIDLPPFLDPAPYGAARAARGAHRARLAAHWGLEPTVPWLLTVAMMRPGDKLDSYRRLAAALGGLGDRDWRLLVVGDGPARGDVEAALGALGRDRVVYAGEQPEDAVASYCGAADIMVWPAVNEAYGMALLEAQAAGLPVVAGRVRGVVDVVRHGETGLLTAAGDTRDFTRAVARLLDDDDLRHDFGAAAAAAVVARHGLDRAAAILDRALAIAGASI